VADFRDPWLSQLGDWGPTRWHERYAKKLRRRIVCAADAVTAANNAIASTLAPLNPTRLIEVIHNGYDDADFAAAGPFESRRKGFTVLFYGTLAPILDPGPAFRMLGQWRQRRPEIDFRVVHVGASMGIDSDVLARSHGLGDVFSTTGYRPHAQAITALMAADLVIVPLTAHPGSRTTVPGRVFEVLRSLRPLLLIASPTGEAARILQEVQGAWCVSPDDIAGGLAVLDGVAAMPRHEPVRSSQSIGRYERREQTRCLAALLDKLRVARRRNGV
jgi:glycosyltransferase involved in cell wall biosynthesis